jgi:hypothetical protein
MLSCPKQCVLCVSRCMQLFMGIHQIRQGYPANTFLHSSHMEGAPFLTFAHLML